MPRRYVSDRDRPGFLHVYKRAIDGRSLFMDDDDRMVFGDMMNRHLTRTPSFDGRGRQYRCFRDAVSLIARCPLTSHHHNVMGQKKPGGVGALMKTVMTSYVRYYNQRHKPGSPLFDSPFDSVRIHTPDQLRWKIAYVHDNHKRLGVDYGFSTHRFYLEPDDCPSWLDVERGLGTFGGVDGYLEYLAKREIRAKLDRELRG